MILINKEICDFCGTCVAVCHPDAIFLTEREIVIDRDKCTECENCMVVCPVGAVRRDTSEA